MESMETALIARLEAWAERAEKEWAEHALSADLRMAAKLLHQRSEAAKDYQYRQMEIEGLDLSVRAYHCLHVAGIRTVADILKLDAQGLRRIRNMNGACAEEIIQKTTAAGFDCTHLKCTDKEEL